MCRRSLRPNITSRAISRHAALPYWMELREFMREWRRSTAKEKDVPAFVVLIHRHRPALRKPATRVAPEPAPEPALPFKVDYGTRTKT